MDPALFSYILSQVKAFTDTILLHVMGEPLLHPQLDLLLDLCDQHQLKVNLTTNGILIEKVGAKILNKPALRQINFSLHSLEVATLSEIDHYLDSVFSFVDNAQLYPLYFSLRLWNLDDQTNHGNQELNTHLLTRIANHFNYDFEQLSNLISNKGIKLRKRVYLNPASVFTWPDDGRNQSKEAAFCQGLRNHVAILVDGTVVPCCLDNEGRLKLGNIKSETLTEILANKRSQALIHGFNQRIAVEKICQKCEYRNRFTS